MNRLQEIWVRVLATALTSLCLGAGLAGVIGKDPWALALAGVLGLSGLSFSVLSLHERPLS